MIKSASLAALSWCRSRALSVAAALIAASGPFAAHAQEAEEPAGGGAAALVESLLGDGRPSAGVTVTAPPTALIDPTTGEPYTMPLSSIDPATGLLVDSVTLLPLPRPPVVDPVTGLVRPDAPVFNFSTGQLEDSRTRMPVPGAPAIDPATGALIDPATGAPIPNAPVIDLSSGRLLPISRVIDPLTGVLINPTTLEAIPAAPVYDPVTQRPLVQPIIDPLTGLEVLLPGEEGLEIENPYGPQALLENGDFVTRGTLIVMLVMFSATWYIILTKLIDQSQLIQQSRRLHAFWNAPSIEDGVDRLPARSPFRMIASLADARYQAPRHGIAGHIAASARTALDLQRAIQFLNARLQGGMAVLATVGATAPFVGLFGTVWGIYNALIAIGVSGEPSIERVAGPVGEALIMTAIGLFVAVPAVFLYNVLGRRNKVVMDTARAFAADVEALITSTAHTESRHGDVRAFARG